jgi:hypothetical protein
MERDFEKNDSVTYSGQPVQRIGPTEKIPMHPDDFKALLAWITAKRFHESGTENNFSERSEYARIIG